MGASIFILIGAIVLPILGIFCILVGFWIYGLVFLLHAINLILQSIYLLKMSANKGIGYLKSKIILILNLLISGGGTQLVAMGILSGIEGNWILSIVYLIIGFFILMYIIGIYRTLRRKGY